MTEHDVRKPGVKKPGARELGVWKVEWMRLIRTRRLVVLLGAYAFFGVSGPLLAAYAKQIFQHAATGSVTVTVADPVPADGLLQFTKSAMQLGLVVVIVVAALAFCVDARPALAAYYRTRSPIWRVMAPRLVVTAAAATFAYLVGLALAWYETTALIGNPGLGPVVDVAWMGVLYTLFIVSLAFVASALCRSALATVGMAVAGLFVLPLLGQVGALTAYLPSALQSALTPAAAGHSTSVTRALITTVVVAAIAIALARKLLQVRTVRR